MKILVVGDLHNQFNDLNALINKKLPDIVICCGDFGYWPNWKGSQKLSEIKPQGAKIYWIDGNHDDHWSIRDRQTDELEKDIMAYGKERNDLNVRLEVGELTEDGVGERIDDMENKVEGAKA